MLETLPKLVSTRFNSGSSDNLLDMETISRKDLIIIRSIRNQKYQKNDN